MQSLIPSKSCFSKSASTSPSPGVSLILKHCHILKKKKVSLPVTGVPGVGGFVDISSWVPWNPESVVGESGGEDEPLGYLEV